MNADYNILQSVIDSSLDIIQVFTTVRDQQGKIVDFVWVANNRKAVQQNGDVIGKSLLHQNPDVILSGIFYRMVQVMETAISQELEQYYTLEPFNDKWFYLALVKQGNHLMMTTRDITDRKTVERRQAFMLRLSDALRPLIDPFIIQETAARLLGEELDVDRVMYVEIDERNGVCEYVIERNYLRNARTMPVIGRFSSAEFGPLLIKERESGRAMIVKNVEEEQRLSPGERKAFLSIGIKSYIATPLLKEGKCVAFIAVQQVNSRSWTKTEVNLVEELAERTWAAVEQAKAERALRQSEKRLQVTLESAKDYAIVTLDTKGFIQGWSKGAELIFGFTEQEAIGKFTGIFFTPEQNDLCIPEMEMATALKHGVANDERWHIRKDGSRIFMNGVMRPIYNPSLTGFVKVARNMTSQKVLEQQKEEFIGIAGHELKTPITSITVLAELLQEKFEQEQNKQAADSMAKLVGQVNRLTNLIKDLLDTTKIVEGKLALNLEEIQVNPFIEKEIEDLRTISPLHHIVYNFQSDARILVDRERIVQVLTNLLSNAFKYSPKHSTITISTEQVPEGVKISIRDQGIGIPVDVQSKIFDRFFRVSNQKTQSYPGMGLGLYISAGIIHRHEGSISVVSNEAEGSTFSFILPIKS